MITGSETPSLSTRVRMMLIEFVHLGRGDRLPRQRLRLQDDLEAALEVEALA